MKKIFHYESSSEPYVADAAVLCCFDHRIQRTVRKFLDHRDILRADMIVLAGGAKTLASPRNDFERNLILEDIRLSIRLHQTKRVYLMSHSDCATYGGLAAFNNDRDVEVKHHHEELRRAAAILLKDFPELKVECFFITFDGVMSAQAAVVEEVAS